MEGRKEMFYLTTHSTHLRFYGAGHVVNDHLDSERGNPLPPLFYMQHPTDRIVLCYTCRGALAGTRNSSTGPPCRIDPTTHHTMSEHSYHRATSRSIHKEMYNVLTGNIWVSEYIQNVVGYFTTHHQTNRPQTSTSTSSHVENLDQL